jgi:P4 family phage/plasmid primase-like protien
MKNQKKLNKCYCKTENINCKCMIQECDNCEKCCELVVKEFDSFMSKRYKRSGDGKEMTHTCMDSNVKGAWCISKEDYPTFIKLYTKFSRKITSAYVERSPYIAPYYFDIDFHTNKQNRYYDEEFVKETIKRINRIINKHFDIDTSSDVLTSYVFEKFEPSEAKEGDYKDGFHIMWPELILDVPSRYFIYDKFMENIEKDNYVSEKIPHTNELGDVFDKSVIEANGVLMYGCAKPGREPYVLTKVYNGECKKILPIIHSDSDFEDDTDYESNSENESKEIMEWEDIINVTAMRTYEDNTDSLIEPISDRIKEKILEIYENKYSKKKKTPKNEITETETDSDEMPKKKKVNNGVTDKDIKYAREIAKILSKKRAINYESWRNVGWALHNISDTLYDSFIDFSKKAGKDKFDESGCKKLWENAKNDGFSIGSLRMWAIEDDSDEFDRIVADMHQDLLDRLVSCAHDDVATYVHSLYGGLFVCTDIEKSEWFYFNDHRWHRTQKGNSLFEKISVDVPNKIACALSDSRRTIKQLRDEQNKLRSSDMDYKSKVCYNNRTLIDKLKDIPYKKNLMTACAHKFFNPKFKEKLNSNIYLLGFENGVYNTKPEELGFRDGVPDDYLSFSVGYDYIKNPNKDYIKQIKSFFSSCLPNEKVQIYVLLYIASCLNGKSKDQKFPFWIGSGGNGKSVSINMISYTFGDYYSNMSVAYLTQKRNNSSNASPELADKVGKRVITFQEAERGEKLQGSKFKELCGNDKISARALFSDQIYFTPQAKYILATNIIPELEIDGGIRRRLRVVEWMMKFVDEEDFDSTNKRHVIKDNDLDEKIQELEWKQNFMWLLINEYYPLYLQNGLCEPKEVSDLSGKVMENNDKIGKFLSISTQNCDENNRFKLNTIYEGLVAFFKDRFGSKVPNFNDFIEYMRSRDYRVEEKSNNNVYIYGLELKDDSQDD